MLSYPIQSKVKIRHIRVVLTLFRHIERKPTLLWQTNGVTRPYHTGVYPNVIGRSAASRCKPSKINPVVQAEVEAAIRVHMPVDQRRDTTIILRRDRKSTRLNYRHYCALRMTTSA